MSTYFTGEVILWPCMKIPVDWQLCDGSLLSISKYNVLFSLLGTTYGGNGTTTFAIPDLRSRIPLHFGSNPKLNASYVLGASGGTEEVTVTEAQIPSHTHGFFASTAPAVTNVPSSTVMPGALPNGHFFYFNPPATNPPLPAQMDSTATTHAGGSQPHANIMPYVAMNYIICLNGLFPPKPN